MTESISVVLATYNGEKFIAEQVRSILDQTHPVDEIIIVDDRSTDHTIAILNELLGKSSIHNEIYVNEVNLGVVKNFEKGMDLSHGEIIFTSDQDDVWRSDKVEVMLKLFEQNPDCLLAFSNAKLVNEHREPFAYPLWEVSRVRPEYFDQKRYYEELLKKRVVTGATMALRRKLFELTRPFPLDTWLHDGWLAINAPLYGDIAVSRETLIEYRQHTGNVVGASKMNFMEKVRRYSNQLRTMEPMEVRILKEYQDFFDHSKNLIESKNETKHVSDCITFWHDSVEMKHVNRVKGLGLILKSILTQGYQKYHYGGLRGVPVDLAYVLRFGGK